MPIVEQRSKSVYGYGGSSGLVHTMTVNFAPGPVHAQVCLTYTGGRGLQMVGIKGYRYRPDPKGPEKEVDFGSYLDWKSIAGVVDQMSSVTWGIALGSNQSAKARLDVYRWG